MKILEWFKRYFTHSFLNKVFSIYLLITVLSSVALILFLSENLKEIKSEQALEISNQVLSTIDDYIVKKYQSEKSILQRFIQNTEIWENVIDTLSGKKSMESYMDVQQNVRQDCSQIAYSIDNEFSGIYAYGPDTGDILQLGNNTASGSYYYFETLVREIDWQDVDSKRLRSSRENHLNNMFTVYILDQIRNPSDFTQNVGILGICFHVRNIRKSYQGLDDYIKGTLYVLDGQGDLLYDSSSKYVEKDVAVELEKKSDIQYTDAMIYNVKYNETYDYYVINTIPVSAINQDAEMVSRGIVISMTLVVLLSMCLFFFSTRYFSKRLHTVEDRIKQIRNGQLTGFPEKKEIEDEVGYIDKELISMGKTLKNHINKEYVYQLKQKEMELYALQAQINPHFLYNTLESIRMNLYIKGEKEASKMIYILADMFRDIMRKDAVVTIRDEINYLQSYLELFQYRFGSRMRYHIEIQDEIYRYATIKHILQPLVENALLHGIQEECTEEDPDTISITGILQDSDILFVIEDDGAGISEENIREIREKLQGTNMFEKSVGIYNVNNRLKIVYGESYPLVIESCEGRGTKVTVRIKGMYKRELEEYVQSFNR